MKTLHRILTLGVLVSLIAVIQVGAAAQAWLLSYNYKKVNDTYLVSAALTQDEGDQLYIIKERANNVKITAPITNTGGNTREFFWPANGPDAVDGESCAVWSKQYGTSETMPSSITQQGAALRIVQTPTGTRGITVTKNVWYGATWVFNVHVWDSGTYPAFTQLAGFDMSEVMGKMWWDDQGGFQTDLRPMPWHMCARTVGNVFKFKVWPNDVARPDWSDVRYVREVQIPAAWDVPGKAGWYIGHLEPGHSAEFQALQTLYRP